MMMALVREASGLQFARYDVLDVLDALYGRAPLDTFSLMHSSLALEPEAARYKLSMPAAPGESTAPSVWQTSKNHVNLKVRLPELDLNTMAARLSPDGSSLSVSAARKYDRCSCDSGKLFDVALPHTPHNMEDIILAVDEQTLPGETLLTIQLPKYVPVPAEVQADLKIIRKVPAYSVKQHQQDDRHHLAETTELIEEHAARATREEKMADAKFSLVVQRPVKSTDEATASASVTPSHGGETLPEETNSSISKDDSIMTSCDSCGTTPMVTGLKADGDACC